MKRYFLILLLGLSAILLSGCNKKTDDYLVKTMYLDAAFSITPSVRVVGLASDLLKLESLRDELSAITNDLDDVFNPAKTDSAIAAINAQAGIAPVVVSDEVLLVIEEALAVSIQSQVEGVALYDVSILPVWEKWLFNLKYYSLFNDNRETIPTSQTIEEALPLVDYEKIIVNSEDKTVFLMEVGMKIDLGSIVKGYACDQLKTYLLSIGLTRAIIDVGGNIMTMGYNFYNGDNHEWPIKIQTPYVNIYQSNYNETLYNETKFIGTYYDSDITVVSSGVYERYIKTEEGMDYHHILDPRTGYPMQSGLISVTILTQISMIADAYSTASFSLGLSAGMRLVEEQPNMQAVFITDQKEIYISSGLEGRFVFNDQITSLGYTYKGVYNETGN
ncbi:MAG: FAD:protein FMN transferase [Bacilli bacterium]